MLGSDGVNPVAHIQQVHHMNFERTPPTPHRSQIPAPSTSAPGPELPNDQKPSILWRLASRRLIGGVAVLQWSTSFLAAATIYIDPPGASDAQKIATQMLNDAAAQSRGMDFRLPPNPFTKMIEDYEARRRTRALELDTAARDAQSRLAERAAEERRFREEQARIELANRQWARIDALNAKAAELSPMAHVRLGMIFESGRFDAASVTIPNKMSPTEYARARYDQAAKLDLPLGDVALACITRKVQPAFPALWDAIEALPGSEARLGHLERLANGGHVGAAYWIGLWAAGRDVGLGSFPTLPGNGDARSYALRWLGRADPDRLGTQWADLVLTGPSDPDDRRRAMAILESLAVPNEKGEADAFVVLARELLRQARLEKDMVRPRELLALFEREDNVPGMHALAAMYLDGSDGFFQPARAAKVYARMPDKPRFGAFLAAAQIFQGLDAIFGVEQPANAAVALRRFTEAEAIIGRTPGAYRPGDRGLKVETLLWQAYARAEAGEAMPDGSDPVKFLEDYPDAGKGLGRLLYRCALFGRRTTSAIRARSMWSIIRADAPFAAPLSPTEVLLYLQCATRAHDRGGAPELTPIIDSLRALPPREAPIAGAALLAQLAYLPGTSGQDAGDRRSLPAIYSALFRASWRDSNLWGETAALMEVLQISPLTEAEWMTRLQSWRTVPAPAGDKPRAWAQLLAQPAPRAWMEAVGQPWGRLAASLLADPKPLASSVSVLRDSLQLRSTTDIAIAEGAFQSLLALGHSGNWHAQALLEDFEDRYHSAYARRGSILVFREHARVVAEAQVKWRNEGVGFCRMYNTDAKWRAMGRALEHGSIRFSTAALQDAASSGSEAALVALRRVEARQSAGDIPKASP